MPSRLNMNAEARKLNFNGIDKSIDHNSKVAYFTAA